MDYFSERNYGCRIQEFTFRNQRMLSMENDVIKMSLILDKGGDIYEIVYKKLDLDFLWKNPNGIRPLGKYVISTPSEAGSFEDYYFGGWQEVFPGGGPTNYKGAPLGLHGESSLIPWNYKVIEDTEEQIRVELSCSTYRVPLSCVKTITMKQGETAIHFEEVLTNGCGEELEFIWGQHPVYGDRFVDKGCYVETNATEIVAAGDDTYPDSGYKAFLKTSWPNIQTLDGDITDISKMSAGEDGSAELFYLGGFQEEVAWYALRNPKTKLNLGIAFDSDVYSRLWMWRVFNGSPGFPLYGRSFHLALEPFSSYPNNLDKAIENGTALKIQGFDTMSTSYVFVAFEGDEAVKGIGKDGKIIV